MRTSRLDVIACDSAGYEGPLLIALGPGTKDLEVFMPGPSVVLNEIPNQEFKIQELKK